MCPFKPVMSLAIFPKRSCSETKTKMPSRVTDLERLLRGVSFILQESARLSVSAVLKTPSAADLHREILVGCRSRNFAFALPTLRATPESLCSLQRSCLPLSLMLGRQMLVAQAPQPFRGASERMPPRRVLIMKVLR